MKKNDEVAIFWDYENCPVPAKTSFYTIVNNIRSLLVSQKFGRIKLFKAYLEMSALSKDSKRLQSELQSSESESDVTFINCPHNGKKEVVDKMIIVDMLAHAIDTPPSTIVLISGDSDFAGALSTLKNWRYRIVLITHSNAHRTLRAQASSKSLCFNWSSVSGTVVPISVLHQPTSPRRGKTSIPPTDDRCHSDIKDHNFSRFPFQEPNDENPASSVEFINRFQDKVKYKDTCPTPPKRDLIPDFLRPGLEPPKRQPASSMASTNLYNSPVASSCRAHINDVETDSSHDSNSLPCRNTPKNHGGSMASGSYALKYSTGIPNLVLKREVALQSSETQPLPQAAAEPDFLRRFSPSPYPVQQNAYSINSYTAVHQIYNDLIGNSDPESSPPTLLKIYPPTTTNATTRLPTSALPSSLNHTSAAAQISVKTTDPVFKPLPFRVVPHKFKILVQCLKSYRSKGILSPLRSEVALEIDRNGAAYRQAGVTRFREYAELAEKEGIIELGNRHGTAWIALLEEWV